MLNFHITEDFESTASKLLEYMNTSHDILKISNFVIVNANTYFSQEELNILENEISSLKHNVKNAITIDEQNCEIF